LKCPAARSGPSEPRIKSFQSAGLLRDYAPFGGLHGWTYHAGRSATCTEGWRGRRWCRPASGVRQYPKILFAQAELGTEHADMLAFL
jgi:hypothetical protein